MDWPTNGKKLINNKSLTKIIVCPMLTNKTDRLRKELRQVLAPVVRDGNLLVLEFAGILKQVG